MRHLISVFMIVLAATGCSRSESSHPGVQINDSLMYISANPLHLGTPVTFWHELSSPRRNILREALSYRYGPSSVVITPEGAEPIPLSTVEVTSARLARKVTVKQRERVLYEREEKLTAQNLDTLCSCTVTSTDWADVRLTDDNITFSVDYWRYYETKHFRGGYSIVSDLVMIPVDRK